MGRHKFRYELCISIIVDILVGPINGAARTKRYFSSSKFCNGVVSVSGMISRGSAYSRIGSETTEDQRSKQVAVASYTTPFEHYDGFYTMPYIEFQSLADCQ